MKERARYPEDSLPSIGWNSSQDELTSLFRDMTPIEYDFSTMYGHLTALTTRALHTSVGIPLDENQLFDQLSQFSLLKPTQEQLYMYKQWYEVLEYDYPDLADYIAQKWYEQVNTITNPFMVAKEAALLLHTIQPDVPNEPWQQNLELTIAILAENMRERLPHRAQANILLQEQDYDNIDSNLKMAFYRLQEFLRLSQQLGTHEITSDLNAYVIDLLTLPMIEHNAHMTSWLLDFTRTQMDSHRTKIGDVIQTVFDRVATHPLPKTRNILLVQLAQNFLQGGYWGDALKAWDTMTFYGDSLRSIEYFVGSSTQDSSRELVRDLYPALTKRNPDGDSQTQTYDWNYFWWRGAQKAAQSGVSLLGEPEVLTFVADNTNPTFFPDMVANIKLFPHETDYRKNVYTQLTKSMQEYNRGYLDRQQTLALLKALLLWKKQ